MFHWLAMAGDSTLRFSPLPELRPAVPWLCPRHCHEQARAGLGFVHTHQHSHNTLCQVCAECSYALPRRAHPVALLCSSGKVEIIQERGAEGRGIPLRTYPQPQSRLLPMGARRESLPLRRKSRQHHVTPDGSMTDVHRIKLDNYIFYRTKLISSHERKEALTLDAVWCAHGPAADDSLLVEPRPARRYTLA